MLKLSQDREHAFINVPNIDLVVCHIHLLPGSSDIKYDKENDSLD